MDISCKKCGQKYHIPDEKAHERRLYFNCEKCNYKIIIDQRRESWQNYKGLSLERFSSKDILEGIYYSFNMRNILLTFFLLLAYTAVVFIISLIFTKNPAFIAENLSLSLFIIYLFAIMMIYLFDIHLYMLSKSIYHSISYGENLLFSSIAPEIRNDIKPVFLISIGFIILFTLFFVPVYLMKSRYSFVYEGIFHTFNLILLGLILLTVFFKGIIFSFIAFRVRSPGTGLRKLISFFRIENLNLPFYAILIGAVSLFLFIIFSLLLGGASLTIFGLMVPAFAGGEGMVPGQVPAGPFSGGLSGLSSLAGRFLAGSSEGMILVAVSTGLVFLFLLSYTVNLYQSLSAVAVYIMEKNPGRSVSRIGILTAVILFAAAVKMLFFFIR